MRPIGLARLRATGPRLVGRRPIQAGLALRTGGLESGGLSSYAYPRVVLHAEAGEGHPEAPKLVDTLTASVHKVAGRPDVGHPPAG